MPTLDWIGKQAVVNHHREVPYRLIHCDAALSAGDAEAGDLLVQGDNLQALRALLPYYAASVKCIYIDPPYNTGNEGWVYNDNVNSPEMRAWLGQVVGREAEDLSRHDKWLCMMYPRLRLLREFLREDGAITVSIDDNEIDHLLMLMDEIFGRKNRMGNMIWRRRATPDSRNISGISEDHEYLVCYGKTSQARFAGAERDETKYSNPDQDLRGPWMSDNLTGLADALARPNLHYIVVNPLTGDDFDPHPRRGWAVAPDTMKRLISEGKILWPRLKTGRPRIKRFLVEVTSQTTGYSTLLNVPNNSEGTRVLNDIFGDKAFPFPKPHRYVSEVIGQIANEPGDLILDSFAGSGTTGHAVLDLNKQDGGNRQFILVEMDEGIASTVTAERLRRVITGYDKGGDKVKAVAGLGGGFRFCRLGVPLFDEYGDIAEAVTFPDLAAHIFFSETGVPIPQRAQSELLGVHQGRAVYLLFDAASAQTPREAAGNVLTPDRLEPDGAVAGIFNRNSGSDAGRFAQPRPSLPRRPRRRLSPQPCGANCGRGAVPVPA